MTRAPRPALADPEPASRLRAMASDGTGLHAEVHGPAGDGVPAVVLIHGWTGSVRVWAPVIRLLRGELRVIAYDQRGHGGSDPPGAAGCGTGVLADDLEAVLAAALPPGTPAVLAGHSMGAMAIMAAADRPAVRSRASAVLLASTGCARLSDEALIFPFPRAPWLAAAARRLFFTFPGPLGKVTPASRALLSYATLGPAAPPELASVNADIIHACDRRTRAAWGRVLASLDLSHTLAHLDMPARVLVGSADRLTPPAGARRLAGRLPH
ncbi:MAG: alpha/beta fold hydrolase, partial [Actinobacteria bacterium]|nr:alpha/beta fold hydrolase [Actinomycetota bacterium]